MWFPYVRMLVPVIQKEEQEKKKKTREQETEATRRRAERKCESEALQPSAANLMCPVDGMYFFVTKTREKKKKQS